MRWQKRPVVIARIFMAFGATVAHAAGDQEDMQVAESFPVLQEATADDAPEEVVFLPSVAFISHTPRVGVRTFLNPGWNWNIPLTCSNCTSESRLAIRPITNEDLRCRGFMLQMKASAAAAVKDGQLPPEVFLPRDGDWSSEETIIDLARRTAGDGTSIPDLCKVPEHGPCWGSLFQADVVGRPVDEQGNSEGSLVVPPAQLNSTTEFVFHSSERLLPIDRRTFFHHTSAICLYSHKAMHQGWLVGYASVRPDMWDMQAYVLSVCFFGLGLPLICLITFLLHYSKYERCKNHVENLRLEYQREQLGRELSARSELGSTGGAETPGPWAYASDPQPRNPDRLRDHVEMLPAVAFPSSPTAALTLPLVHSIVGQAR